MTRPSRARVAPGRLGILLAFVAATTMLAVAPARADAPPDPRFGMAAMQTLDPGDSYEFTFSIEGGYVYHCHLHPEMAGVVVVANASEPTQPRRFAVEARDDGTNRFVPDGLEVRPGDTVSWTNNGTIPHNVAAGHVHTFPSFTTTTASRDGAGLGALPLASALAAVGLLWMRRGR